MALEVVTAGAEDWPVLAAVGARAFRDELPYCALFPREGARQRGLLAWFRVALPGAVAGGSLVETTRTRRALSMWSPPDRPVTVSSRMRAVPGLLPQIWTLLRAAGRDDLRRAFDWGRRIEKRRHELVTAPHWSLDILAVDPDYQRLGHGAALLLHGLARVDACGLAAYVETNQSDNVEFYGKFGFVVAEHVVDDYPPMRMPTWRMVRAPR